MNRKIRDKTPFSKQCIFCEQTAQSREHVYPKWIQKYILPVDAMTLHKVARPINDQSLKLGPAGRGKMFRTGDALSQKAKVVCNACNNGWMSEIESETEEILSSIISGNWSIIENQDIIKLRKWIQLRSIIFDQLDPQTSVISKFHRMQFRDGKLNDDAWGVTFARFRGFNDRCFFHSAGKFRLPIEHESHLLIASCMFTVGKVVFQSFYSEIEGITGLSDEISTVDLNKGNNTFYEKYGFCTIESDIKNIEVLNTVVAYDLDYLRLRKAYMLSFVHDLSLEIGTPFDLEKEYNSES